MDILIHPFTVQKQIPLTISRGTSHQSSSLWVRILQDDIEGWGEASPFSTGDQTQTTAAIAADLMQLQQGLASFHPLERQAIHAWMAQIPLQSAAKAAIDVALHDWLGKRAHLPLWQLWGLNPQTIVPTSVTIGISSPEAAQQRWHQWQQQGPFHAVKVKLGSPEGMEADQAMLLAIKKHLPPQTKLSVDANGGWSLKTALLMAEWLTAQGVTYLEQPLPVAEEAALAHLYERSPLPIFLDESCWTSQDIPRLAAYTHGINIKLMKSGGLSEAYQMIHAARSCGLQIMFGCYSDSSLSNTALAHLSPLADHLDLDSHLNLVADPFTGATLQDGRLIPNHRPGLGLIHHGTHPN